MSEDGAVDQLYRVELVSAVYQQCGIVVDDVLTIVTEIRGANRCVLGKFNGCCIAGAYR